MASTESPRVTVVALGDLGRSPRTLYHAAALADSGADVDLVGYATSALPAAIGAHARVRVHPLRAPTAGAATRLPRPAFLAYAALRVIVETVTLGWTLLARVPRPDVVLVQSPPAVPTLAIALLAARLRGARLVVDWHNLGAAVLGLALGPDHVVVRLAARYERRIARRADAHLCVSEAMRRELTEHWGLRAVTVLHDRPAAAFVPTPLAARHELFRRLGPLLSQGGVAEGDRGPIAAIRPASGERTLMTEITPSGECRLRADRPALIVSPTSWTPDEDFTLLLDALARVDTAARRRDDAPGALRLPPLLVVLTGDGPLRARYAARLRELALARIMVRTLWLSPEDYPRFLGCADLGLSLHRSASGLDLPMKVADMRGAGVPVCALDYGPCLGEAIRDGETGVLFRTAAELATVLAELLRGFPDDTPRLDHLRGALARAGGARWVDEWTAAARPLFFASAR